MSDLTEFLLARIAEDEAVARAEGPNQPHGVYCGWSLHEGPGFSDDGCQCGLPARVLAECKAKRRIVEIHHRIEEVYPSPKEFCCRECSGGGEYPTGWPCDTLRALLAIYADHPDFRPEWAD